MFSSTLEMWVLAECAMVLSSIAYLNLAFAELEEHQRHLRTLCEVSQQIRGEETWYRRIHAVNVCTLSRLETNHSVDHVMQV